MLVAVIMSFLVLSFTGVAVLDLSYNSMSSNLQTRNNIKAQYIFESTINEALWKINNGVDTQVNDSTANVVTSWDEENQVLSVSIDTAGFQISTDLAMESDIHFTHNIATRSGIQTNGYSYDASTPATVRRFEFLPEVSLLYYIFNAVHHYNGNQNSWKQSDLEDEGIHIFYGNNLDLSGYTFTNSTLIFTGRNISFDGLTVNAATPAEGEDALPAIVIINSTVDVTITDNDDITGAIYSRGDISLEDASITGPVVAEAVTLLDNINFRPLGNHGRWTRGFGEKHSYDWPKHVKLWKTNKWEKKRSS